MVETAKGAKAAKLAQKNQVRCALFGIFVSFVVQSGSSVTAQLPPAHLSAFDIEVQYSPEVPSHDREAGPPLRAALTDQLGLRVQDIRAAVDVLVVDRVERPQPD